MDFTGFAGQAYPDNYPSGQHAALTGASEVGSLGYIRTAQEGNKDSVYDLSFSFPHSDNTLKLNFSALGLQPIADESWGLDNVVVTAADPTWPPGEVQNLVATGVDSVTENISFTYNNGTCNAANNNIYYGPLTHADLAAYNYTGAVCGIGNSGVYDSFNPGTGSFFFVVVGNDGSNTEGSYGTNLNSDTGTRTERPPFAPNACTVVQSLTNRCDCY